MKCITGIPVALVKVVHTSFCDSLCVISFIIQFTISLFLLTLFTDVFRTHSTGAFL